MGNSFSPTRRVARRLQAHRRALRQMQSRTVANDATEAASSAAPPATPRPGDNRQHERTPAQRGQEAPRRPTRPWWFPARDRSGTTCQQDRAEALTTFSEQAPGLSPPPHRPTRFRSLARLDRPRSSDQGPDHVGISALPVARPTGQPSRTFLVEFTVIVGMVIPAYTILRAAASAKCHLAFCVLGCSWRRKWAPQRA